jgi:hypothetical protein
MALEEQGDLCRVIILKQIGAGERGAVSARVVDHPIGRPRVGIEIVESDADADVRVVGADQGCSIVAARERRGDRRPAGVVDFGYSPARRARVGERAKILCPAMASREIDAGAQAAVPPTVSRSISMVG